MALNKMSTQENDDPADGTPSPANESPADVQKRYFRICISAPFFKFISQRLGNDAFLQKNYELAIKHYSEAMTFDPENPIYYSNRRYRFKNHDYA
jgi:hypothetical protein